MPLCDVIHGDIELLSTAGYISLDFSYLSPKQPILELQSSFALTIVNARHLSVKE